MIKADLGWGVIALDIYSGMLSDDKKKKKSHLCEELRAKTSKTEGRASPKILR